MHLLAIAVAVFAVAALAAGARTADNVVLFLAAASLICAWATWRARGISAFLKIFVAIFAAETVVFGLGHLIAKLGLWPAQFSDYKLPESLPLTVAIFAILVYAISHIPVVGSMTRIADRYFSSGETGQARVWPFAPFSALERRVATAMVVALVLINQAQVGISVRLSFFNRDWFNALQDKNAEQFWRLLLWVFVPWAFIYVFSAIVEFIMQSMLIIRWRRWLTDFYIAHWLGGGAHYRMGLAGHDADNPDQRIAEDVNRFIDGGSEGYGVYSYSILLISTLSSLVSFAIVLWGLSANFTIPGTDIALPGLLFWVALIYAAVGTVITHLIGRPLVRLLFDRQRYEADFRFGLARLREYGEQVALLKGEPAEQASLGGRFRAIIVNYLAIVDRRKKLMAFTSTYGQINPIIPYLFTAPFYFLGKIQLGVMTQTAGAFARVESALTFFITYYTSLAGFKSVLDRLTSFDAAIEDAHAPARADACIARRESADGALALRDLSLALPDGRRIVSGADVTLRAGQSVLVTGPSGSGKSTLFRAIAGIWPYGEGAIETPKGARALLLPQKPYIPITTLHAATTYPAAPEAFDAGAVRAALIDAGLPALADRLGETDQWSQRLSGGEQQRLAIARALLAKPDWLFLDEATSAMDEAMEARIYELLAAKLPEATLVSIGHRASLARYHQRRIEMRPQPDGAFTAGEAAPAPDFARERQ
jgi:putative ATP-binding cassette transporter